METWHQRFLFWLSAVVVGAVSLGFGWGTVHAAALFHHVTTRFPLAAFVICPAGLAAIAWTTRRVFPGSQGSGIPQAMAAIRMERFEFARTMLSWRIAIGKTLLTLAGFAVGASIGKEGPTVQIGCSVMNGLGGLGLKPSREQLRLLVLAGAAAGIASAFNTPIAGAVFAIEEMAHYQVDAAIGRRLLVVTALSGMTMLALVGNYTYFGNVAVDLPWGRPWIAVPVIGIVGGVLGGAFARVLSFPQTRLPRFLFRFLKERSIPFAALCGLMLAGIGIASGGLAFDASHGTAQAALQGLAVPPLLFPALKWLATVVSYLSGIPGGIFAPSLAVGAGLSAWFAPLFPHAPLSVLAMLGMAAYFSGVVQSPITAAVIVLEMTNNTSMTVAVSAAAAVGTAISRLICRRPLYAAMADQFLEAMERR
ncbi:MAG: chloride channel protein [Rhodospirillales bacterium]|nr:chloride channel protein [Rhodospirillales bacterium]